MSLGPGLRAERVEGAIGLTDEVDLDASDVAATGMTYSAFKKIWHRACAQDSDLPRGDARAKPKYASSLWVAMEMAIAWMSFHQ